MEDLTALRVSQEPPFQRSCGLRAALDIIAGKWKPLILWHLLGGPMRFTVLHRALDCVSEKILAEQLKQLEADGVVLRRVLSQQPLAVDYSLTELGRTLAPALAALSRWGFDNVVTPAGGGVG